jgi:hypothetical protein
VLGYQVWAGYPVECSLGLPHRASSDSFLDIASYRNPPPKWSSLLIPVYDTLESGIQGGFRGPIIGQCMYQAVPTQVATRAIC